LNGLNRAETAPTSTSTVAAWYQKSLSTPTIRLSLFVSFLVLFSYVGMQMLSPSHNGSLLSNLASTPTSCPDCTFKECQRTLCPKVAPYVCTTGAAHDGCGSLPAAWIGNSVCTTCCDSLSCSSTLPGPHEDIKLCAACTPSECSTFAKRCDSKSPYVCTDGGATNGCTADKYHWPSALNGICNKCCDISQC
jgi:hypothetical protein